MSFLRLKKALKDHSGSGMVVVLVTSFFIILLATTLLYAVLSSYYVRSSERRSNTNFDSADAGMDQIRAGLQEAVSDAVGEGYDYVLKNYSNGSPSDLFKNEYLNAIRSWSKNVNTATGMKKQNLFNTASGTVSDYNIDVLKSFLGKKVSGASYELTSEDSGSSGSGWGRATEDADGNIVLKGIHLKFTNKGYETNITSDISLAMPDTGSMSSLNDANLNEYVIVADKGLNIQSPSPCEIDGHMYTGEVNIGTQTNGSAKGSLVINSGESLIVGQTKEFGSDGKATGKTTTGSVNLFGRMKYENNSIIDKSEPGLTMNDGSTLWAHDINVAGSSFNMLKSDSSKVYVADDLDIGRNAKVKLSGSYTGFGSEDNVSDPDAAKAGSSSSILFSSTSKGDKSKLDLTDLKNLTLAGRSFVELNKKNTLSSNEVGMGSSITARNEQLCYLIPSDLMGDPYTNPAVVNTSTGADGKISVVNGTSSISLATYIDSLKEAIKNNLKPDGSSELIYNCGIQDKSNIKVLAYPVNGQNQYVLYAFMNFPKRADANKYFKSLFESNGSKISDYISQYVELETATGSSTVMDTAGTSLENTGSDLAVGQSSDQKAADPNNKTPLTSPDTFKNLSTTYDLYSNSMTTKTVEDTTPFNYYIDIDRLHALLNKSGSSKYKFSDGSNYRDGSINVDAVDAKGNKIKVPISAIQTQSESGKGCTYRELSYKDQADYSLVVAKGDYSMHESATKHIFIVDGNVYINNHDVQEGLIMCTGKIYANSDFKFDVFNDDSMGWTHVTLLQNFGQGIWRGGTSVYDTSGDWTSADLVTYQNWKKNKD